ncbi:GspH/FimT family pseudopilin [Lysobacter enzymogenes]|uniref:GspH/FimT family pseudopilin n=1 Tax=Lysobacter enzymogenes TaxID=69 RepID=UPI00015D196E|nr:GspH/FimT family pseudopilin [Lysobacter enzymogenes]
MSRRRRAGFTLIELLVTIAVAAILLALALPSFTAALRSNRVSSATNLTLASLNLARAEALRSKTSARVCPAPVSGKACGGDWSRGLLIWTDENNDKNRQDSEVKRIVDTPRDIQISMDPASTSEIVFDDRGRTLNRTSYTVIVKPSVCKSNEETKRSISVSGVGRVQVKREKCV